MELSRDVERLFPDEISTYFEGSELDKIRERVFLRLDLEKELGILLQY